MIVNGKSTAATYTGASTDIWNQSLKNLTATKKQLAHLYVRALNSIEVDLQRLREKGAQWSVSRLEKIQANVKNELRSLTANNKRIITSGYVKNFNLSYYGNGYELERFANQFTKAGYTLGQYQIPQEYVIASLNQRVAGLTFTERMTANIVTMQREVRQSIGVAVIRGDSAATTARNIQKGIDGIRGAMQKSVNASLRIARTELLQAYSLGHNISSNNAESAGVDLEPTWDATLDGKTRDTHANADGKPFILDGEANWQLTVGGVVFSEPRLVLYSAGGDIAGEVINCRCRRRNNPFGFKPVSRVARKMDGTWESVNGDKNYTQWAKTLEGRKEIERTISDRALRAKELRIMRTAANQDRRFTAAERKTLADIRRDIKGRVIGNVGTNTIIA
jgi:hypothetical protein